MARHDTDHRRRQRWAERRRMLAAQDHDANEGVKQTLRSAERLRVIGVTPHTQNPYQGDSWRK